MDGLGDVFDSDNGDEQISTGGVGAMDTGLLLASHEQGDSRQ